MALGGTTHHLSLGDTVYVNSEKSGGGHIFSEGVGDSQLYVVENNPETVPANFYQRLFILEKVNTWASVSTHTIKEGTTSLMFGSLLQLRHRATNRLVNVFKNRKGRARATFHVQLIPDSEKGNATVFRVMPRYKIRQEGEKVTQGDHLVFFNEHYKVHLSTTSNSTLIAASNTASEFSISPFEHRSALQVGNINAGHSILFFHKEQESFFSGDSEGQLIFTHPHIRDSTYNIAKLNYSSNSLWMIESPNPSEGGTVHTAPEMYRLRHSAGGGYLCVSEKSKRLFLNKEEIPVLPAPEDTSLWCFMPCDARDRAIASSSTFFRLWNPSSETWLHANPKDSLDTPSGSPKELVSAISMTSNASFAPQAAGQDSFHLDVLQPETTNRNQRFYTSHWDFAVSSGDPDVGNPKPDALCTMRPKPAYVDVFCATLAPAASEKDLHSVLGHRSVLLATAKGIKTRMKDPKDADEFQQCTLALTALIRFCTFSEVTDVMKRKGLPLVKNQRMLQEQRIHQAVLDVLFALFAQDGERSTRQADTLGNSRAVVPFTRVSDYSRSLGPLITLAFRFLTLFICNNEPGCNTLIPFFPAFTKLLEVFPAVCDLLVELCALKAIPLLHSRNMIAIAVTNVTRAPQRYFSFLTAVCTMRGIPQPAFQVAVCEALLQEKLATPKLHQLDKNSPVTILLPPQVKGTASSGQSRTGSSPAFVPLQPLLVSTFEETSHDQEFIVGAWRTLAACNFGREASKMSWLSPDQLGTVLLMSEQATSQVFCALCACVASYFSGKGTNQAGRGLWNWGIEMQRTSLLDNNDALGEQFKAILMKRLQAVSKEGFDSSPSTIQTCNELMVCWNTIILSRGYTEAERNTLVEIIGNFLDAIPSPRTHPEVKKWSEANILLMECVNHVICLLHSLLDHSAEMAGVRIRDLFVENQNQEVSDEFLGKVRGCCLDKDLTRTEWVGKLFEMAQFDHARLANNALRCAYRILVPNHSVTPHLNVHITFNTQSPALRSLSDSITVLADHIRPKMDAMMDPHPSEVRESAVAVEAVRTNIEECVDEDVVVGAQHVLLQTDIEELLFRLLEGFNKSQSEELQTVIYDILFVLNFFVQDSPVNAEICLGKIHIFLALVALPRVFTTRDSIGFLSSLFSEKRDITVDLVAVVPEYFPGHPGDVSLECVQTLITLVKNSAPGTQQDLIGAVCRSLEDYDQVVNTTLFRSEAIGLAVIELISVCYKMKPSPDLLLPIPSELLMKRLARAPDLGSTQSTVLLSAFSTLYLGEAEHSPMAEEDLDPIKRIVDKLRDIVTVGAKHPHAEGGAAVPVTVWRILADFCPYVVEFKQYFIPQFTTMADVAVRLKVTLSVAAESVLLFLENVDRIIATERLQGIEEQRTALRQLSTRTQGQSSPSTGDGDAIAQATTVAAWRALVRTLSRSLADPIVEQLKPLIETIHEDTTKDGMLGTMVFHLQNTMLDDWVTSSLLITLSSLLEVEMATQGEAEMFKLQDRLNMLGATPLISTLLERQTYCVVKRSIRFGIALLQGGNKKCQDSLIQYFHTHDEKFFYTIRKFLKSAQHEIAAKSASGSRDFVITDSTEKTMLNLVEDLGRLLQLLCEGHHFDFQNYVRHQHDNFNSYNLCFLVMEMMHSVIKVLDPSCIGIANQCLNTLTEVCQGPCPENQAAIVGCNVVSEVNRLLTMEYSDAFEDEEVMGLKTAAIVVLLSLLEGSQDASISNLMLTTLHITALEELLETVWQEKDDDTFLDLGFTIYILANVLLTEGDKGKGERLVKMLAGTKGHKFFNSKVCSIEVWRDDDPKSRRLETVYFRKPEICNLREETREHVLNSVNRSSIIAKHSDFFTQADDLIFEMEYQFTLEAFAKTLPFWQRSLAYCRPRLFEDALLYMGLLANMLLVAGYETRDGATSYVAAFTFLALGIAQSACALYLVVIRFVLQIPLLAHRRCTAANQEDPFLTQTGKEAMRSVTTRRTVRQVGTDGYVAFYGCMLILSILSVLVSPFFSSSLLMVVCYKAPLLSNIVKAITTNGRQLLLTAFLGAIMVYFFSVAGYLFFHQHFENDEKQHCGSLVQCFFFSFGRGVRGGGGIGEMLKDNAWEHSTFFWREAYDASFFVVVAVIVMNIIFALIVDTFAELRDAKNKIEEDMATTCFICGIDNATFEREGERFADHTKGPHNMWRYLYFMHHLRRKEQSEFTGQETYVFEKMRRRDLSFFPVNRSKSLEKALTKVVDADSENGDILGEGGDRAPTLNEIKAVMEEALAGHRPMNGRTLPGSGAGEGGGGSALWARAKTAAMRKVASSSPAAGSLSPGPAAASSFSLGSAGSGLRASPGLSGQNLIPSIPAEDHVAEDALSLAPALRGLGDSRSQLAAITKMIEEQNGM